MNQVKAIQATYYDSQKANAVKNGLAFLGYEYKTQSVTNVFNGEEITVIVPSGKGKTKHIEIIDKILGRGIDIYLNNKKYNERFSW